VIERVMFQYFFVAPYRCMECDGRHFQFRGPRPAQAEHGQGREQ
jgi:hypothetical protein